MLTAQMPSLTRALTGVLPPAALKQLTQSLGNCNQEMIHRGPIAIAPDAWQNVNNRNGAYYDFPPSLEEYNNFYNTIVNQGDGGTNISNSFYNNVTNLGDVIINPGGSSGRDGRDGVDGLRGVDGINGVDGRAGDDGRDGAAGPAGAPGNPGAAGANGRDGRDGAAGAQGEAGAAGPAGPPGAPGAAGANGRDGRDGTFSARKKTITFLTGGKCELSWNNYEVMVGGSIDQETCEFVPEYEERWEIVAVTFVPEKKTETLFGP